MVKFFYGVAVISAALVSLAAAAPGLGRTDEEVVEALNRRQYYMDEQQSIAQEAENDPIAATKKVLKMPNLGKVNGPSFATKKYGSIESGWGDDSQVPWFDNGDFPFTPTKQAQSVNGAWNWVPGEFEGFKMNTDLNIGSGDDTIIQPYYITNKFNPNKVKRAIVSLPGRPRDSWKYANLFYNALKWVYAKNKYGIEEGEVIIVAPLALNQDDQAVGGTNGEDSNWAVYRMSNWEFGGSTQSPKTANSVSFYTGLDKIIDNLMDKSQYPNLNKVVVAGHSMGGQAVVRYALMKHEKSYDSDIMYWAGNPGSYTWLVEDRPTSEDCKNSENSYPYGMDDSDGFPKYARAMVENGQSVGDIVNRFRSRTVHYALGLLDNGAGDTHCEALAQGANHLQRGANFVQMLNNQDGGLPGTHTVSYVPGVSHQDYPMIAADKSLDFIFGKNF